MLLKSVTLKCVCCKAKETKAEMPKDGIAFCPKCFSPMIVDSIKTAVK